MSLNDLTDQLIAIDLTDDEIEASEDEETYESNNEMCVSNQISDKRSEELTDFIEDKTGQTWTITTTIEKSNETIGLKDNTTKKS